HDAGPPGHAGIVEFARRRCGPVLAGGVLLGRAASAAPAAGTVAVPTVLTRLVHGGQHGGLVGASGDGGRTLALTAAGHGLQHQQPEADEDQDGAGDDAGDQPGSSRFDGPRQGEIRGGLGAVGRGEQTPASVTCVGGGPLELGVAGARLFGDPQVGPGWIGYGLVAVVGAVLTGIVLSRIVLTGIVLAGIRTGLAG